MIETDYDRRFKRFRRQPPKSSFKRLILGTDLIKGLKRMSDKSFPKGLKAFGVEMGHTRAPPIPYIPVADDVAEAVTKRSGALEYKLELPSGIKVSHALWESGNAEAFHKHVMAAMSYVAKRATSRNMKQQREKPD